MGSPVETPTQPRGWGLRYRAFISYSHADAHRAAWLHRRLEAYRLPSRLRGGTGEHGPLPERLTPIFRDRDDLSSAGQLGPQIEAALAQSEALVVVCSPSAARSPFVDSEILAYKRLGRGDRIYAFIVDGEPNTGDARECFPSALRFELQSDGRIGTTPANPIAADARAGKDGKSLALLKLLAGLFGLPLDTLRQREAHRRHQRMAAITALAVAVMLVTSVLAVQAVIASKDAERRQKQAEALVGFMLGDLSDRLAEVSRLDILTSVNDKAMDYFRSLPKTDVTDEALQQRAKALVKIGNVRTDQGQFKQAMVSFLAAAELAAPLAKAAPKDIARQLSYADILAYIGTTHWYQGDLPGAQRGFDEAHKVLVAARKLDPHNRELLIQLSTVDNNNGHLLESHGAIEAATTNYRRMLEVTRQLAELAPADARSQQFLSTAHNNLAKMALLQGDLASAIAGYRENADLESRLAAGDPRNNAQRERLLIARATLGRTLALTGELEQGSTLQQQALAEAERLYAMEPASTAFQYDVGLYALQRARVERQRGHFAEADALLRRALTVFEAMIAASPDQPAWQRDHAEALTERAEIAIAQGRAGKDAATPLRSALAVLEPQLAQSPQERATVLATMHARLLLASVSTGAEGIRLAERSLAAIDAQASARNDPRLLSLRIDALRLLGSTTEADDAARLLHATGYKTPEPGMRPAVAVKAR